jgi:hypothetical protein
MYAYYAATGLIPRDPSSKDASQAKDGVKDVKSSRPKPSFINTVKAAAAVTITPLQILQMIIGSYAIFHTHSVCPDTNGPVFTVFGGVMYVSSTFPTVIICNTLVMYVSYLALFLQMFSGKIKQFFGGGKKSPKSPPAAAKKAE